MECKQGRGAGSVESGPEPFFPSLAPGWTLQDLEGWDVCTAHNSFPLLRKEPQLFSVQPWAVVWAPLGCAGQSLRGCPVLSRSLWAVLSSSCAARPGPCYIPMANSPSLAKALPLLSTVFLIPTSFFHWDWSRGIHARTGPGWAGTGSCGRGWAGPGGDTWLRLGLRRANKHLAAWMGTESPVSAQPRGGSSLIKGCR